MSKFSVFENNALQKSSEKSPGFNLAPQVNSFNSIFETKPLDESESNRIECLLLDGCMLGSTSEEQVKRDVSKLKLITSEIRAIGRQGIVLMGERVYKAKEILKLYKDGTFTRWLESTFGTRKTAYNVLSYFELHRDLPKPELKERFKKIPLRAAYVLASREGSLNAKADIIREYYKLGHNELVTIIQKKLPVVVQDKRAKKSFAERLIIQMRNIARQLENRKHLLTVNNREALAEIQEKLKSLLL